MLTTFLALGPVDACAAEDGGDRRHGGWEFSAIPYFWLPETHGTAHVGDVNVDFDCETGTGHSEKGLDLQMRGAAFGVLFTF